MRVERDGRHRYHRLAGADVAHAIEALSALARTVPVRSLRASNRMAAHRAARSCYDHLAGQLGVAVTERLCAVGGLEAETLALRTRRRSWLSASASRGRAGAPAADALLPGLVGAAAAPGRRARRRHAGAPAGRGLGRAPAAGRASR